jgi:hypothetical protein
MNQNQHGIQVDLGGIPAGLYTMTFSSTEFFEKHNLTVY